MPEVTLNQRSPGGERTARHFSTGLAHMALSHRAKGVYRSPVRFFKLYMNLQMTDTNTVILYLNVPLSFRPMGGG